MSGPPTTPFLEVLRSPIETCIQELNDLIVLRDSEGFDLVRVFPCPGKNWVGAGEYHWIIVWKPKIPAPV